VETAKENGVNPTVYLTYLFERTSPMDLTDEAAFGTLLPWPETLTEGIRVKSESDIHEGPASNGWAFCHEARKWTTRFRDGTIILFNVGD